MTCHDKEKNMESLTGKKHLSSGGEGESGAFNENTGLRVTGIEGLLTNREFEI